MHRYKKVLAQIKKWNAENPPGTEVMLCDNSDTWVPTKTRSAAWGIGDTHRPHTAVVLVEGKVGGWELERMKIVSTATAGAGASIPTHVSCAVCGEARVRNITWNPDVTPLLCGVAVNKYGDRLGQCERAERAALERAALLRRARLFMEVYALSPDRRPDRDEEAVAILLEIDKLPRLVP